MDIFNDFDFDDDLNLNSVNFGDASTKPFSASRSPTAAHSTDAPNSFIDATTKEPETKKTKKKRLDADLLLSTEGLPRLMSEASFLSFQGPGHEEQNLKKLMRYYQIWANSLFPKFRFTDFAQKVGNAASHKTVKERISIWQDEYRDRHQVRADVLAENRSSEDEEEEDEDAFNQLLLDSVFPVVSNKKSEEPNETKTSQEPEKDKESEEEDEEPEKPPTTRKRRLICLDSDEDEDDEKGSSNDAETVQQSFGETDLDLSDIPIIPDTQMEDIGYESS
ncbi:replication fork protection component Swi3-domain-containing protein [Sporodiniella umbellata]|nr:replication fork protection component Swi3-domain-containing protein [Sporodiniella umbellata]